jgi:inner membrane protein
VALAPEIRHRGMFRATVYGAQIGLQGEFVIPRDPFPKDTVEFDWPSAFVLARLDDVLGRAPGAALSWNGRKIPWDDCSAVAGANCRHELYLVAPLDLKEAPAAGVAVPFVTQLDLRGTQSLGLLPLASETRFTVSTPWQDVSFVGAPLPREIARDDSGVKGSWQLSSNIASRDLTWMSNGAFDGYWPAASEADHRVGVDLREGVPIYQMVERAAKYGPFFLALSFLTYFLFETVSGVRIHVIQYGMLALSIALFSLLLLSLSEPLGFTAGYCISAAMVLLQASLYTGAVTRQRRHGITFGAVLAGLLGFLYVVLTLETFSLLVGSAGLFAALSVAMTVTRRVSWSRASSAVLGGGGLAPRAAAGWLELD